MCSFARLAVRSVAASLVFFWRHWLAQPSVGSLALLRDRRLTVVPVHFCSAKTSDTDGLKLGVELFLGRKTLYHSPARLISFLRKQKNKVS